MEPQFDQSTMNANRQMMIEASKVAAQVNAEIAGMLKRVELRTDDVAKDWQGQAAIEYRRIMAEWRTQSAKLNHALQGIGETITSNMTIIDTADQDNVASLKKVDVGPLNM